MGDAEPRMRRFARQIVRRHQAAIERVAAELEARTTLPGPDIDAISPNPGLVRQPQWWDEQEPQAI